MSNLNRENRNLKRLNKRYAENSKEFVVIIGAGISSPGLPLWSKLASHMIDELAARYKDRGLVDKAESIMEYRDISDLWRKFDILKRELGTSDYEAIIKEQLTANPSTRPLCYELMCKLNVAGYINFNLDHHLLDAYSHVYGTAPHYATGKEPHKFSQFLSQSTPFFLQAHGVLSDPSSWIMTSFEKGELYKNEEYKKFITSILNTKNLIIAGFNPRENAFIKLLEDVGITHQRIAGTDNFCILPEVSAEDDLYLQEFGLSVIRYDPENSDFHEEVVEIFQDLLKLKPQDELIPSVYRGKTFSIRDIPSRSEAAMMEANDLRNLLNGIVAGIIPANSVPTDKEQGQLMTFYTSHSQLLHLAWYLNPNDPSGSNLMEYTIKKEIGKGSFGQVYEAYDKEQNKYAIKVLLSEVREKASYLNCFRRGTRAMKILKDRGIDGIVKIHTAFEVPACIVMDYIEGPTLREVIDNKIITELYEKLDLICKIAYITHSAHQLEERILHRDLKPENIILRDYFTNYDVTNVTIFDFDLAWHRGATERTVFFGGISQGFMAPEQAEADDHITTRNTSVDVYSIGMLLYYTLTGLNPIPNYHGFSNFKENILTALKEKYKFDWKVLPHYLTETILEATYHDSLKRLSLSVLMERLLIAKEMHVNNTLPKSHPLLLEELAMRIDSLSEIKRYDDYLVLLNTNLNKEVHLSHITESGQILLQVKIRKMRSASDPRNVSKYLIPAKEKAMSKVDKSIFFDKHAYTDQSAIEIIVKAKLDDVVTLKFLNNAQRNIREIRSVLELK